MVVSFRVVIKFQYQLECHFLYSKGMDMQHQQTPPPVPPKLFQTYKPKIPDKKRPSNSVAEAPVVKEVKQPDLLEGVLETSKRVSLDAFAVYKRLDEYDKRKKVYKTPEMKGIVITDEEKELIEKNRKICQEIQEEIKHYSDSCCALPVFENAVKLLKEYSKALETEIHRIRFAPDQELFTAFENKYIPKDSMMKADKVECEIDRERNKIKLSISPCLAINNEADLRKYYQEILGEKAFELRVEEIECVPVAKIEVDYQHREKLLNAFKVQPKEESSIWFGMTYS
jgi:hypothetical protein